MKSQNNNLIFASLFLFSAAGILSAQTDKSYSQLKAEHPGWVQIPGRLIRPDCVHEVPSGAQVKIGSDGKPTGEVKMNGQLIAHYDSCPEESIDTRRLSSEGLKAPSAGDGWIEASQWELSLGASDNIDYLFGTWHVPNPPVETGALVYLFNGIEPAGGAWIMQPVLQWGSNGDFGGNYYTFASWLVGPKSSEVYHSTPINVNSGDSLTGVTEQDGAHGNTLDYFVTSADPNIAKQTTLNVTSNNLHWVWAFAGVLEAYYVTSCSQFPVGLSGGVDESHFYNTLVAHGYPSFDFVDPEGFYGAFYNYNGSGGPQCHFSQSVSGNGSKSGSTSLLTY
jgi:hypothetical protein